VANQPIIEEPLGEAAVDAQREDDRPVSVTELPTGQTGSGGGGSTGGVALPAANASELEIRRWMLEHPSQRDLVKHRLNWRRRSR
jgi:hypothetical protein